ncbi:MAG: glycosyltransferase family 2 protein [Candidatus Edwardsbacteria bacterium]|nr:glycosyltransferase family 2 protein [Candidatus Edwardsbacteria bacterium]
MIIPAYNAAETLPGVLQGVLGYCRQDDVVVIDDGSTDGTAGAAARSGVRVSRSPGNEGKGAALARGFAHAVAGGYDAVVTLDADGQHPPGMIPELVRCASAGECDVVIASRRRGFAAMRPERALSNRLTTLLVSLLAGVRIEDSQCGCRLVSTGLLRRLSLAAGGFQAESELLIQAGRLGARIGHVGCPVIASPSSHIGHLRDTAKFIALCLRYL